MEIRLNWHSLTHADIFTQLNSSPSGLSFEEATRRITEYGPNELHAGHRVTPWEILAAQFKNVLIIILLIAVLISVFVGHGVEAIAISAIVLFAALLGFIQEFRAERAIEALHQMAAPTAAVFRDGEEIDIPAREVVPGDVVLLHSGDRVPADGRIIDAINLQIDEAALTGESVPVSKHAELLENSDLAVGDRLNMAFSGTAATYGRGRMVVVATGMQTEFGKIAQMLQSVESGKTPLQENLDKVGKALARAALIVVAIIVGFSLFRGQSFIEMLIFGIALAVAVVPEALPAVVTVSLAVGVQRMVKRNALVRRLAAVETLGSTSVICSDKTGTLTKDEMTVRKIYAGGHMIEVTGSGYEPHGTFNENGKSVDFNTPYLVSLLQGAVLASDVRLFEHDGRWEIKGDPTEGALVVAAAKAGLKKAELEDQYPRVSEIPFSSETKRMTTLHQTSEGLIAYSKGAPEVILDTCICRLGDPGVSPLDDSAKESLLAIARKMAGEALRVLAVAYKTDAIIESAETKMTFLGLVGIIDPPRPEAKAAIQICEQAGIKTVMITGDHPVTAQAIASELGILKNGRGITGAELDAMDEDDFEREVENIDVYARVSPAHKLRVVTALQKNHHIVAMTGDGVNDAPALKKADIGIAMGITGTDVSKEAAAITLTDDNFASIVAAVEEGREIFGNIKKYLMYLLSSNIGEIGLMAGATLLGIPMPLTAVQILYVNLATDGLPALALSVDPPEHDLMHRKPRDPRTGIFTRPIIILMVVGGLWSALVNLSIFSWALNSGRSLEQAITMTFVSLVLIQFFKAYNFRSDQHSVLTKPFANKWLNLAILWEIVLLVLVIYLPVLHDAFGTFYLPLLDWVFVLALALTIVPVLELAKFMVRRGWFGKMV